MSKQYTIAVNNQHTNLTYAHYTGTLDELINIFKYTLEKGKLCEHEKGNAKINMNPRTGKDLVNQLTNAVNNSARNCSSNVSYELIFGYN